MSGVDVVVGSGPSGIACAAALLARGRRVLMIDGGMRLEPDRAAALAQYRATPPGGDPPWLAESDAEARRKIPRKLLFGSDFPFQAAREHLHLDSTGVGLEPTLATGGFSTIWGAAILPFAQDDIGDWPITAADLGPHYEASVRLIGLSGRKDDLAPLLPLYTETPGQLAPSAQAEAARQTLDRHRGKLRQVGIQFGRARVAVEAPGPAGGGCVYCGMCLSGCPYDAIYCSERTLAKFRRDANFTHESDVVITEVTETGDHAIAKGYHRITRTAVAFTADRLFLACGVIPTTRILLHSRKVTDKTLFIKDSQYFLLPVVLHARVADVRAEKLHTLSQLFIEISDPRVSPHLVHLQAYSYNRFISAKLRATLGPVGAVAPALLRLLENRLMLLQCYLHSTHSSAIAATLRPDGRFELRALINPETKRIIGRVVRKLVSHSHHLGLTPLPPLREIGEPGRGFHSGGTFPMRADPGPFESDRLGRPFGWRRIHAVDSTVLPSIPATTITLPVMANAHRIATESLSGAA
jgi:choline dehydrogenase-like flavoprotein